MFAEIIEEAIIFGFWLQFLDWVRLKKLMEIQVDLCNYLARVRFSTRVCAPILALLSSSDYRSPTFVGINSKSAGIAGGILKLAISSSACVQDFTQVLFGKSSLFHPENNKNKFQMFLCFCV